ncbi:O-antigen ligase [Sinomonas atrocyanea]|uniref:O-antigen ligase family protein n=1 Tax=Sinomonas atrocyanea TaxID=37927 RepID=UPI00278B7BDF|nr:O-antigen ligase family protein [Sinomonas atrocyanea]MDP9883347.1 O-antigen ligase [Sinomonas atrocyanea]
MTIGVVTKAPVLTRLFAVVLFVLPSTMVIKPIGASGTAPMILAVVLVLAWLGSVVFGRRAITGTLHPAVVGVAFLVVVSCTSYAAMFLGVTGGSTDVSRLGADRWLLLMLVSAGLMMVLANQLRSLDLVMDFVRALLAGACFCSFVAVLQFLLLVNPMQWVQTLMLGFTYNGGDTPFQARGAFVRVSGSTFHSIELAAVSSMLLPLSVWRAIYDSKGKPWLHWSMTGLLIFSIAATVSRSGVLGLLIGLVVFTPFMPKRVKRWALFAVPTVVLVVFATMPGMISTLVSALTIGQSDPSISTRTDNYPRVESIIEGYPWTGLGPGNYSADTAVHVLDNQYLSSAVNLGIFGIVAVATYFFTPWIAAAHTGAVARSEELRCLAGAVMSGTLVASVCSATFDSLSFPIFALTFPVLTGIGGAAWRLASQERALGGRLQTRMVRPPAVVAHSNQRRER